MQDLRREQLQDVLQLEVVLWDAWTSLTFQASEAENRSYAPARIRHEKKNKYRRDSSRGQEDAVRRKKQRKAHVDVGGSSPARYYRCPIVHCVRSRPFAQLSGVFNHLYVLRSKCLAY